jgi:N-acetylglutamate synthase-like GNAT family acetyltransferase
MDDGFTISDDKTKLDLDVIHGFLSTAYWSVGISRARLARAIEHSLCFGIYEANARQIGFGRVISDRAVMAHLCDVFILDAWRGRGLGKRLVATILAHPELQGVRRWSLATNDAHELYQGFGFGPVTAPEAQMQRIDAEAYARPDPAFWAQ